MPYDFIRVANREAKQLPFVCPACRGRLTFGKLRCDGCGENVEQVKLEWEEERDRINERLSSKAAGTRGPCWGALIREKRTRGRLRPWGDEWSSKGIWRQERAGRGGDLDSRHHRAGFGQ